jgi:hypothetical protein
MTGAVPPGGSEGQHPTSGQRPSTSDKRICDLHRRTIADMTIRTFSDKTRRRIYPPYRSRFQRSRSLPRHCNRRRHSTHPGRAAAEDELQASALRLFFTVPLGRTDLTHQVARTRYPRKLPRVLTADLSFRVVFTLTSAIGDIRAGSRQRWQSLDPCRANFLSPARVLFKLFRHSMLTKIAAACAAGQLQWLGVHAHLADGKALAACLAPLKKEQCSVYSKRPFPAARPRLLICHAIHCVALKSNHPWKLRRQHGIPPCGPCPSRRGPAVAWTRRR